MQFFFSISHNHSNVDGASPGDCQHLTVNRPIEEEQGDKMKKWTHPAQHSFRLKRNVSTNSREEVGAWVRSRLSIYSNSSGIGSISTYQSQLDLSIRPISPIEQSPTLSSVSGSVLSSTAGNNSCFRSKSQRERGISDMDEDKGALTRGRNISWTNSILFQRMR